MCYSCKKFPTVTTQNTIVPLFFDFLDHNLYLCLYREILDLRFDLAIHQHKNLAVSFD